MSEEFVLKIIPERIRQLGYHNYQIRYRDFTVKANAKMIIPAFNELWYISNDPPGLIVESGYGVYDSTGEYLSDNSHQHRGEIQITNPDDESKRIKFIQVIIVN
jgi:hypothetical protein